MARISRKIKENPQTALYIRTARLVPTALYVRRSVEELHGIDPIESQKNLLQQYLEEQSELELHKVYIDNGFSGTNFDRPAFTELLEDIEKGLVKCLVIKDLSRLGRDYISTGYYLEKYFPLHDVRVIALNDNYDSDVSSGDIAIPLTNMYNEIVARDTSKKVKLALDQLAAKGKFIGGRAPYGYRKAEDDCRQLVVNEETAPFVKELFHRMAEGTPINQLVKDFNQRGIPTPSSYYSEATKNKVKSCNEWHSRTLHKLLKDEVYIGNLVQGKTKIVGKKQVLAPVNEWKRTDNTHELIIDKEIFDKVQRIFGENKMKQDQKNKNKTPYPENLLKEKLFCGDCERPLHHTRHRYSERYQCIIKYRIDSNACQNSSITKDVLLSQLLSMLKEQRGRIESSISSFDVSKTAQKAEQLRQNVLSYQEKIANSNMKLSGLFEMLIKQELSEVEYFQKQEVAREQKKRATSQFMRFTMELNLLKEQLTAFESAKKYLQDNPLGKALTKDMVDKWIGRIFVSSEKGIKIEYLFKDYHALQVTV